MSMAERGKRQGYVIPILIPNPPPSYMYILCIVPLPILYNIHCLPPPSPILYNSNFYTFMVEGRAFPREGGTGEWLMVDMPHEGK
jgi:hypothetical protein